MDKYEARLAAETASICEVDGIRYYAIGVQYMRTSRNRMQHSIILHDLRANSVTSAKMEDTTVVRWNFPPDLVAQTLEKYRSGG